MVVQAGMIEDMHGGVHCAGFRIVRAVDKAPNAGVDQRAGTHRAWLDRGKQVTIAEPVIALGEPGFAKRNYFRVGRGIGKGDIAIESPTDDFALVHNDSTNGHFSSFEGTLCGTQRFFHPKFVVSGARATCHDQYCIFVRPV